MAEQLGLEELRSDRGSIERDERTIGARAVPMKRARDELLARARFAGNQHGKTRAREPADRAENLLHRGRLPEDAGNRRAGALRRACGAWRRGAPQEGDCLVDVEWLRKVFECAAAIGGDRMFEIRMSRHHDDGQPGMVAPRDFEQAQSFRSRHAHVRQQHVGTARCERGERRIGVIEEPRLHARLAERAFEHPPDRSVIVDDPDFKRLRHARSPSAAATKTRYDPAGCRIR